MNVIINNQFLYSFKSNMIKLRSMVKDQPISDSIDRAIWWIEYVIRHGGTVNIKLIINSWLNWLTNDFVTETLEERAQNNKLGEIFNARRSADCLYRVCVCAVSLRIYCKHTASSFKLFSNVFSFSQVGRVRRYSKSLPFEKVTRGSKMKVL